jgi:hypothetical protein
MKLKSQNYFTADYHGLTRPALALPLVNAGRRLIENTKNYILNSFPCSSGCIRGKHKFIDGSGLSGLGLVNRGNAC